MLYDIKENDVTYQTSNAGQDALIFSGSSNEILLAENARISSTHGGSGIVASGAAMCTMELSGMVTSTVERAIETEGGGQTIKISSTGSVYGQTGGVVLSTIGAGLNRVDNQGLIMSLKGAGIATGHSSNSITNGGTIIAEWGIFAGGATANSNNEVHNSGIVIGANFGVVVVGDQAKVVNTGTIRVTSSAATAAVGMLADVLAKTELLNLGKIESKTLAVGGAKGDDLVTNRGAISGSVKLNDGNDLYNGRGGTITGNIELGFGDDTLLGGSGSETVGGEDGNDILDGGLGDDFLSGGAGIDTAVFSGTAGARADLNLNGPQDTRYGSDILLAIENLTGGAGADRFIGSGTSNTLTGGLGNDKLTGGSGADFFVFNAKLSKTSNVDTITDFSRVDDTFRLENAIFKKLTKVGVLNKAYLAVSDKAKDKNDYIVYDKAKGALYYDADGSGKGAAVKFAQITKGTMLGYNDFYVI